jgi:predicted ATPase/class 3 adenylate cyclase/tetratricopeptide (TPR) repeat protein
MDPTLPATAPDHVLPTGTVTFLFTDVEGSTRLWEQYPAAMRQALARHDALIEDLVVRQGGVLVRPRGEGDGRFAVFPRATDAVAAAATIQQALSTEPWPAQTPLRVRMALHTGEADLREGDYYGSAVNRCARLRAIAHGGQTLLSQATYALVRDNLPPAVTLVDLGAHRLADLQRAEQVYQLLAAGVPADYPPLRSLETVPNNLPLQPTSFVGREREIAAISQALGTTRLLTLTGAGGAGKTRLAVQVAADVVDRYSDGVWFVDLAPLADPALVPTTAAAVLGVRDSAERPAQEALVVAVRSRHLLLVLDNCEHLLAACAALADALVRACPRLRILATSRAPLDIAGETVRRVPSLALPDHKRAEPFERLAQYEAVRLFIERAVAARSDFQVTNATAPALAEICWRLDGIPLAIELAAARVRVLGLEQLARRLDDRFRLLTGGSRTAVPRQQTLRALVDWSHDLLSAAEQTLLRRLSVFAGGWTLEAAEAICAEEGIASEDVLDLLSGLVDQSLVVADETEEGSSRYGLLETLRQYGREKLVASGDAERVHGRHAAHCLAFASAHRFELHRMETEHDNLRAALTWCFGPPSPEGHDVAGTQASETGAPAGGSERASFAVQLAGRMGWFWYYHGHRREGLHWLERALAHVEAAPPAACAQVFTAAGAMAANHGDSTRGLPWLATAVALYEQLGDRQGLCSALTYLGGNTRVHASYVEGTALLDRALALARDLADPRLVANVLGVTALSADLQLDEERRRTRLAADETIRLHRQVGDEFLAAQTHWPLGLAALYEREYAAAREAFAVYRDGARAARDTFGVAVALTLLGDVARVEGDLPAAAPLYQESLAMWCDLGVFSAWLAHTVGGLGEVALAARDLAAARAYFVEGLTSARQAGALAVLARNLEGVGRLAAAQGRPERAARLGGAAETLRRQAGPRRRGPDLETHLAPLLPPARLSLGAEIQAAAWAAGQAMTLEEAIAEALQDDAACQTEVAG